MFTAFLKISIRIPVKNSINAWLFHLNFQCIANAKPLYEVELIWFKDGRPIDEAGIAFSFNDLWNRTLSLINADFAHEGRYKCQVRMKTGGPRLTKEAKVTVIGNETFKHSIRK